MSEDFRLDKEISSKGLSCRLCGEPLDTKTTLTLLCKKCKGKEWSKNQRRKFKEKHGIDNPMKDSAIIKKIQETMMQRYGANCAMNVPEFRKKLEETNQSRYGTSYYINSEEHTKLSEGYSVTNQKFQKFLESNGIAVEAEKVYDNKRFDFRIQNSNVLIEIDPSYTHSRIGDHWNKGKAQPKDKQLAKTLIAERNGYRCIHVFDWDNKEDILSLISPKTKIYARKCEVVQIKGKEFDSFINDNHIQKNCKGTVIALGLYYNSELIEVMTFGKPRYNHNYKWELLRLCTRKDLKVIGGASKLFKYATNILGLTSIISYCDRSKFSGDVYSKIGMKLIRRTVPQEIWSKGKKKITGSLLRQRGYDQLFGTNYGKGTSNEELMLKDGWLPVYDCGQLVFAYGDPISKDSTDAEKLEDIDYETIVAKIENERAKKQKICKFCGEPFIPNSSHQVYCKRPHYMTCPICGKEYLVTNNENLKRPPVACSYECRKIKRERTSMEKYGIKAPGNNPEAREKAKKTMQEKYGVDYAMMSKDIYAKGVNTLLEKYGVDNIQKLTESNKQSIQSKQQKWLDKVHNMLPIKLNVPNVTNSKLINDTEMEVYLLNEATSREFLTKYGHNLIHNFRRTHLSVGLIKDKTVYQVMRFERMQNNEGIILSDFGTMTGYLDPNYYSKLMKFVTDIRGIDSFDAKIPRYLATPELINSMKLTKVEEGDYEVYWNITQSNKLITISKLVKLSRNDNIEQMLSKYSYVTSDYLDQYTYSPVQYDTTEMNKYNIQQSTLNIK